MSLRKFGILWACLSSILIVFTAPAFAGNIVAHPDKKLTIIVISGEITKGDGKKFRQIAQSYDNALVLLQSDGGLTLEAIEIGEAIRLRGFQTAVFNDADCSSACALIWLAGTPRVLSRTARVGFHASYVDVNGRSVESGVGNAIVGRYLTLLNLPERAVIFATSSSPDEINWLTSSDSALAGIEFRVADDVEEEASGSSASRTRRDGNVYQWGSAGNWAVYVDPSAGNGCFLRASWDGQTKVRLGIDAREKFQYYLILSNAKWTSLRKGDKFQLSLEFDKRGPWDFPVLVSELDGILQLVGTFQDTSFWGEFAKSRGLTIHNGKKLVADLAIPQSGEAFVKLVDCQKIQNANSDDPFAR